MADVVFHRQAAPVEHVTIESPKPFAEVEAALEAQIPPLDPAIIAALTGADEDRAKTIAAGVPLFRFLKRDHGALLEVTGKPQKVVQYEIGNPITATRMTRRRLEAALYAPLRVVLYETPSGGAAFEYDQPSSLFGQFGDDQVAAVGRELDAELKEALERALQ